MSSSSKVEHEHFGIGTLFNRLNDAVVVVDPASSRIVLCNPASEALFGYAPEALIGLPVTALIPSGWPDASGGSVEVEGRTQGGEALWIEVSLSPIENTLSSAQFQLAIIRDIGERKRIEAALESSEARFRAFMDFGPAIASMRDIDGRYIYTNALHRRLFGSEHWIGTTAFEHLPEEIAEQVVADDQVVLRTGKPAHFEERMPGQEQLLTLLVFKFPFQDSSGQPLIGSLGVDVTPLKRAQAALHARTAELEAANEALRVSDLYKDEFLSVLSHELRTPITTIYGFIELLEDGAAGELNALQADFVRQVEHATQRLLTLVSDLIDFAQLQAGVFPLQAQRADGPLIIREAAETFGPAANAAGVTLQVEVPEAPVWLDIDAKQIGRVVRNLVGNAIRYTPRGGTVTVTTTLQGSLLLTEVTDTGVGIGAEDVPKLFDRFWQFDTSSTRTGGGLGLGLPIAKAIVEGHGGTIGARSQLGVGSTFWFGLETASGS